MSNVEGLLNIDEPQWHENHHSASTFRFFRRGDRPGAAPGPVAGKQCAVVLTYDDALNVHLDKAVPALDSLGLKATFYLSGFFPGFRQRVGDWKAAAAGGHELANHTLVPPLYGQHAGPGVGQAGLRPEQVHP
jgi:peptidoglycan/xylan/chitin deacetylase (PgdA/CDA1 family)